MRGGYVKKDESMTKTIVCGKIIIHLPTVLVGNRYLPMFSISSLTYCDDWSWLYSLQLLFKDYGDVFPTFMKTAAWQDKEMNTALASWSELKAYPKSVVIYWSLY